MKRQAYQRPELRDANDNIIQVGTYGKESPLVNGDNTGVLDYINNNLEALRDNINGSRIYVANKAKLPATGDLSAMYIAEDTGKWYLWDGNKYIETDNARKIADEAIAARDAAKASQAAAKTSEQNAKTSESNAAASKQAAATSAGAAKTSENNAVHRPIQPKRGQRLPHLRTGRQIHPPVRGKRRVQEAGRYTVRTVRRLLRPLLLRLPRPPAMPRPARQTPPTARQRRQHRPIMRQVRPMRRPTVQKRRRTVQESTRLIGTKRIQPRRTLLKISR